MNIHRFIRMVVLIGILATLYIGCGWLFPTSMYAQHANQTDQGLSRLSVEQARQAAQERVQKQVALGYTPSWKDAVLKDPLFLYDLSGEVSAYLFPVDVQGSDTGFLTVAAFDVPNPVLEFTTEGTHPLMSPSVALQQGDYQLVNQEKPLYIGTLSYGYELRSEQADQRQVLDVMHNETFYVPETAASQPLHLTVREDTDQASLQAQVAASRQISSVNNWQQFSGTAYGFTFNCASGCAPTAATTIMDYWDTKGSSNLINGSDWRRAVSDMRLHMGTYCNGEQGSTGLEKVSPGMVSYTKTKSYNQFWSSLWCDSPKLYEFCDHTGSFYTNYVEEINADRPVLISIQKSKEISGWTGHTITGIGYQTDGSYLIILDNGGFVTSPYKIHYGKGYYEEIFMNTLAPDTTKPSGSLTVPASGAFVQKSVTIKGNASDEGSGVDRVEFLAKYDGTSHTISTDTSAPYEYTWDVSKIPDQTIELGLDVYDKAGNVAPSPGGTRKIIKDTTPPTFPDKVMSEGSESGVWQKSVRQPAFTWSGAKDGMGDVEGYLIYWGTDPNGTSDTLQTGTSFKAAQTVADEDDAATYYLRMAVRDTHGNTSEWKTVYTFRYDNSTPVGSISLNYDWGVAHSRMIPVRLHAEDTGSGVREMRLSNDGTTWNDWQPVRERIWWPAAGEHSDTISVKVQYRDEAENISVTVSGTLTLNFYPSKPSSAKYHVTTSVFGVNGITSQSAKYTVNATAGQIFASGDYANGGTYQTTSGYWTKRGVAGNINSGSTLFLPFVQR